MKEYIERAAVEKFIEDGLNNPDKNKAFGHAAIEIMTEVHYMPAADVAEVRHGRWERVSTASGIISRVRCSVCAGTQPLTFENMPYCPTCGARMDEEDGHEIS